MTQIRDKTQVEVVEDYIREGPDRCTLELSTGFGKSKIAIDILKHLQPKKVLILVNSTVLRDSSWKDEFIKFNFGDYFEENVELATYQLAYKWKKEEKDLSNYFVIADEVDFAADVPELSKFFYEYEDIPILGLTGFITDAKREWFDDNLPVFTSLSQNDARENNILNDIHFVFVKYDLSKDPRGVKVEYTKGGQKQHFYQSENNAYDYKHKQYIKWIIAKEVNNTNFLNGKITFEQYQNEERRIEYMIKTVTRERATLLHNSVAGASMAEKLTAYLQEKDPDNKIIVFSKRTSQSIKICGKNQVYNGKLDKEVAKKAFDRFKKGEIKILGVCDKINRGVNIEGLRTAIFESFYGSDTQAVQRLGRLMRLKPNEKAVVYIFLPYFLKKTEKDGITDYVMEETQQVTWAKRMLRSTDVKSSEVWDYRILKDD